MKTKSILILILFVITWGIEVKAEEQYSLSFYVEYKKLSDGNKKLSAVAKYRPDRFWQAAEGLKVDFFYLNQEQEEVFLADGISDEKGIASILIDAGFQLPLNEDGLFEFVARSNETEQFESAEEFLYIKDIFIELKLIEDNDIRSIEIHAEILDEEGLRVPLSGEDVYFSIPRMFSKLSLGEETLEDGFCSIPFPDNIVGNAAREVTILAEIPEHADFGSVEVRKISSWGNIGTPHLVEHPSRELWTPVAPLWMIITLIILLVGVWGHYIYAIVQLFLIRKEGIKFERQQ